MSVGLLLDAGETRQYFLIYPWYGAGITASYFQQQIIRLNAALDSREKELIPAQEYVVTAIVFYHLLYSSILQEIPHYQIILGKRFMVPIFKTLGHLLISKT